MEVTATGTFILLEKVTVGLLVVSTISSLLMLFVVLAIVLKHSVPSVSTTTGNVIIHLKVCLHVTCPLLPIVTDRKKGHVFRSVCQSFCPQRKVVCIQVVWVSIKGEGVGLHPKGGVCLQVSSANPPPVLTSSGGHSSGRYAPYWNAFLLLFSIVAMVTV